MKDIKKHTRVNDMLLGPLERPALRWLAERMPPWVTPDVLTAIGVAGSLMIFAGYWATAASGWWLMFVNAGFVVNWFGDSLDGTLARFRRSERPKYGFFIDHSVDAVSEFLVFVGLGLSPYMRLDIALFALVGYLLMSVYVYVRTCVEGVFKISYSRVGPTEMRVIIVVANVAILLWGNPAFDAGPLGTLTVLDAVGITVAVALGGAFLVSASRDAVRLARLGE